MFGWLKTPTFEDPQLGTLTRKRGLWRGTIALEAEGNVPIALAGSRREPDAGALAAAQALPGRFRSWRPVLERELFAHYEPYAESVAADARRKGTDPLAMPASPGEVWHHVDLQFISITPLDGTLTTELGFTTDWDDEHALGARFHGDRFVELNGSVLRP